MSAAVSPYRSPHSQVSGDGCDVSSSCYTCPLVRCKYDRDDGRFIPPPMTPEREAESAALHARINAMIDAGSRWAEVREALRCGNGTIQRARERARRAAANG